jgi:anti-sigma-K factor RskA
MGWDFGWEFWRIEWPSAAVVVALAVVPLWVLFAHSTGTSPRASIELANEPKATALATTDQRTYPHEEQWRE